MYTAKQREMYNHDRNITCERLGFDKNTYNRFRRMGQELHKIYEDQCNGDDTKETEEREKELMYKVRYEANNLNLHVFFQTDPRGATIYLSPSPIEYNNYNRSGSECIY